MLSGRMTPTSIMSLPPMPVLGVDAATETSMALAAAAAHPHGSSSSSLHHLTAQLPSASPATVVSDDPATGTRSSSVAATITSSVAARTAPGTGNGRRPGAGAGAGGGVGGAHLHALPPGMGMTMGMGMGMGMGGGVGSMGVGGGGEGDDDSEMGMSGSIGGLASALMFNVSPLVAILQRMENEIKRVGVNSANAQRELMRQLEVERETHAKTVKALSERIERLESTADRHATAHAKAESSAALLWDRVGRVESHVHHATKRAKGGAAAATASAAAAGLPPKAPAGQSSTPPTEEPAAAGAGDAAATASSGAPAPALLTSPAAGVNMPLRGDTPSTPLSGDVADRLHDMQTAARRAEQIRLRALLAERDRLQRQREADNLMEAVVLPGRAAAAVSANASDAKQAEEDDRFVAQQRARLAKLDAEERAANAAGASGARPGSGAAGAVGGAGGADASDFSFARATSPLATSSASNLSFHALAALLDETLQHKLAQYETRITTKLTERVSERVTDVVAAKVTDAVTKTADAQRLEAAQKQAEREKKWADKLDRHSRHIKLLLQQVDRLEKDKVKAKVDAAANALMTQPPPSLSSAPTPAHAMSAADAEKMRYVIAQVETLAAMVDGTKKQLLAVNTLSAQARSLDVRVYDWEGKFNELDDKVKLLAHVLSRLKQRDDFASIVGAERASSSSAAAASRAAGLLQRRGHEQKRDTDSDSDSEAPKRKHKSKRSKRRTLSAKKGDGVGTSAADSAATGSESDSSSGTSVSSTAARDRKAKGKTDEAKGGKEQGKGKGAGADGKAGDAKGKGGASAGGAGATDEQRMAAVLSSFEDNLDARTLKMVSRALITDPTVTVQQLEAKTRFLQDIKERVYTMEDMELRIEKLTEMAEKVDALMDLDIPERIRIIEKRFDAELKFLLAAHHSKADTHTLQNFLTALQRINPQFVGLDRKVFAKPPSAAAAAAAGAPGTASAADDSKGAAAGASGSLGKSGGTKLPAPGRALLRASTTLSAAPPGVSAGVASGAGGVPPVSPAASPRRRTMSMAVGGKQPDGAGAGGLTDSGSGSDLVSLFSTVNGKANSEDLVRLEALVRSLDRNVRAVIGKHRDAIHDIQIAMRITDTQNKADAAVAAGIAKEKANENADKQQKDQDQAQADPLRPGTADSAATQLLSPTSPSKKAAAQPQPPVELSDAEVKARLPPSLRFRYALPGPFDRYARAMNQQAADLKTYVLATTATTQETAGLNKLAIERMRDTLHGVDKQVADWRATGGVPAVAGAEGMAGAGKGQGQGTAPPTQPPGSAGAGAGAATGSAPGSAGGAGTQLSAFDAANLSALANEISPARFRQLQDNALALTDSLARMQTLVMHHSTQLTAQKDWIGRNTRDLHALRDWLKHAQRILADTANKTQATELIVHMIRQMEDDITTLKTELTAKPSFEDVKTPLRDINPDDLQRLLTFLSGSDFPMVSAKPLGGSKCMSCERPLKLINLLPGGGAGQLTAQRMPVTRTSVAPGGGVFGSAARRTAQLMMLQQQMQTAAGATAPLGLVPHPPGAKVVGGGDGDKEDDSGSGAGPNVVIAMQPATVDPALPPPQLIVPVGVAAAAGAGTGAGAAGPGGGGSASFMSQPRTLDTGLSAAPVVPAINTAATSASSGAATGPLSARRGIKPPGAAATAAGGKKKRIKPAGAAKAPGVSTSAAHAHASKFPTAAAVYQSLASPTDSAGSAFSPPPAAAASLPADVPALAPAPVPAPAIAPAAVTAPASLGALLARAAPPAAPAINTVAPSHP